MPTGVYKRTKAAWNKGKTYLAIAGAKNHMWKKKPGYDAIHDWVIRWKGRPETCEVCGKTGLKGRWIHWANIDHKYRRVLDDYIRMCSKCHGQYDLEHGLRFKKKNV